MLVSSCFQLLIMSYNKL